MGSDNKQRPAQGGSVVAPDGAAVLVGYEEWLDRQALSSAARARSGRSRCRVCNSAPHRQTGNAETVPDAPLLLKMAKAISQTHDLRSPTSNRAQDRRASYRDVGADSNVRHLRRTTDPARDKSARVGQMRSDGTLTTRVHTWTAAFSWHPRRILRPAGPAVFGQRKCTSERLLWRCQSAWDGR